MWGSFEDAFEETLEAGDGGDDEFVAAFIANGFGVGIADDAAAEAGGRPSAFGADVSGDN